MASLGLLSPGAATQGVTPIFPHISDDLLLLVTVICIAFTRVSPCTFFTRPTLFVHFFCKFSRKLFYLRVSPPWRVSPGAVRPLLVTPLVKFAGSLGARPPLKRWIICILVPKVSDRHLLVVESWAETFSKKTKNRKRIKLHLCSMQCSDFWIMWMGRCFCRFPIWIYDSNFITFVVKYFGMRQSNLATISFWVHA